MDIWEKTTTRDGALILRFVLLFDFPYSKGGKKNQGIQWQLRLLSGGELQPGASKDERETGKVCPGKMRKNILGREG